MMYRDTWLEVNLAAIERNTRRIKENTGKKFIAVIKANAYGCGDQAVAGACRSGGADMFAVSSMDEAVMLRREGIEDEILVLGSSRMNDAVDARRYNISLAAYSMKWVRDVVKTDPKGLKVHLKVDTGMSRIGFRDQEELEQAKKILLEAGCILDGIFTHFACADTDPEMTKRQYEAFEAAVKYLD